MLHRQPKRNFMRNMSFSSLPRLAALAMLAATIHGINPAAAAPATSPAAQAVISYDQADAAPSKKYRIAYLTECVDNPYCIARLDGLKAAAKKYNFEFKI